MPRVIAKLSGKFQLQPVLQAGHALCRGKTRSAQPQSKRPFHTSSRGGSSQQTQSPSNQQGHREIPVICSFLPERSQSPKALGAKNSKKPNKRSSSSLQTKQNPIREQQGKAQDPAPPGPHLTSSSKCQSTAAPQAAPSLPATTSLLGAAQVGLYGAHTGAAFLVGATTPAPRFRAALGRRRASEGWLGGAKSLPWGCWI